MMYALFCIPLAYLIGSISSTYIISHLSSSFNLKAANDGRISAATVYRNMGRLPFAITALMDMGLAASAVMIAKIITDSIEIQLLAGLAALSGHNWSIFLKFKGGLGATAIAGILFALIPLQFFYGLAIAAIVFITTRRSGLSTMTAILVTSSILFIQKAPIFLAVYPVTLLIVMILKRWQADGITKLAHWDR